MLRSSDSRRSFCSCNKKVCREANSQTAFPVNKLTPLYLCWSMEVGTWHKDPCVLGCILPSVAALLSREAGALMWSRSCLPACLYQSPACKTQASRQSSGSPWNLSTAKRFYFKLLGVKRFLFLAHAYANTPPARKMTWCHVD